MWGYLARGVLLCGVLFIATGCWPLPNRISEGPDGLVALSIAAKGTDGLYEAFPHQGQIWLVDTKTGRVQTVLTGEENLSWATFSPDGNELLYVESPSIEPKQILARKLSYPWRLVLWDRQRNTRTELLAGDNGFIWAPTFSPDGRKIAFYKFYHSHIGDHLNLHIFDRDSGQEKLLKPVQDRDRIYYMPYGPGPLWTPDGHGIFIFRVEHMLPEETLPEEITPETTRVFAGSIAVVDIWCGCEHGIAQGVFPFLPVPLFLAVSSDGSKLYVNGYDQIFSIDHKERVNLYEITVETGQQRALYDGGGLALAPALSPDGDRLLFTVITVEEPLKANLYLLDLTASAPARQLTDDGRSGFGFWLSPDEIAFLRLQGNAAPRGEVWVKTLSTAEERNLSTLLAVQSHLVQLTLETTAWEKSLEQIEHQLVTLNDAVAALSRATMALSEKVDALQTQSTERADRADQQRAKLGQDISALMADISALKARLSEIETKINTLSARPALSLVHLAIALLIAVIVIVVLVRRAVHSLAQQIALPPQ